MDRTGAEYLTPAPQRPRFERLDETARPAIRPLMDGREFVGEPVPLQPRGPTDSGCS